MINRDILIVEDNPADVRLIWEALKGVNPPINIHIAQNGEEALQFLRREGQHSEAPTPALVFLDFNLPGANSRDVLREIKKDNGLRSIAVAVFTTSDLEQDVREAYALHANCYLCKPSDLERFLATIQTTAYFWLNVARLPSGVGGECVD